MCVGGVCVPFLGERRSAVDPSNGNGNGCTLVWCAVVVYVGVLLRKERRNERPALDCAALVGWYGVLSQDLERR